MKTVFLNCADYPTGWIFIISLTVIVIGASIIIDRITKRDRK